MIWHEHVARSALAARTSCGPLPRVVAKALAKDHIKKAKEAAAAKRRVNTAIREAKVAKHVEKTAQQA